MIDWLRTAGLAAVFAALSVPAAAGMTGRWGGMVIDLTGAKSRPRWRPELEAGTFWPAWAVCFAALSGGALVLGSTYHKGRFSAETAAWAQAAGALVALLTGILTSQLTTARLVRQQRDMELNAFGHRIRSIHNLRNACAQAAAHVRTMSFAVDKIIKVKEEDLSNMRAAWSAIEALLKQPREIDADALQALSRASEVYENAMRQLKARPNAEFPSELDAYIDIFDQAVRDLEGIVRDATAAIMRWANRAT